MKGESTFRTRRLLKLALLSGSLLLTTAAARPLAIGGALQSASVGTRVIGGHEMLAVWTLPRLGISVRNDPLDLRLLMGDANCATRRTPAGGPWALP
ncbi:hypothetical protein ACFSC4_08615 [Deinococcus malanensis]|uniref:hypothetical protein n=1 Tax=Deinococcus malanensis TaxID=1706855 RepID=UPI003641F267